MDFMLNIELKKLPQPITYREKILLIGSCFTEHIGNSLHNLKFSILQNPHGILFDPASVCKSLISYVDNKKYKDSDLFQLNEVWHSWEHHSRFSHTDKKEGLLAINNSQQQAHEFLKQSTWVIITLGSAFSYKLKKDAPERERLKGKGREEAGVANCHRAPAKWFDKTLLEIHEIIFMLDSCLQRLSEFNPALKIIFTVSPVRHIRDGIVENNRSKARLIETVHHVVNKYENCFYFPAYELVIDVLRDHRFYDIDLVHPNYAATEFVLEKFADCCIAEEARELMQEVRKIVTARKHRAFQPETKAHAQFLISHFEKAKELQQKYPFLELKDEIKYFSQT